MARWLIGCEFTGSVRRAFRALGHDAWSCDLLPAADGDPHHIQGDVLDVLGDGWDGAVLHPPCTYLANSGVRWLYGGKGTGRDDVRWAKMEDGARFFRACLDAPIPLLAVENPIQHRHCREIIGRGPDQTIQPWQYGHGEIKATCLWLKGLPPLTPTKIVDGRTPRVHHASPSPDRWKERSVTLPGIAAAMAEQWGNVPLLKAAQHKGAQSRLAGKWLHQPSEHQEMTERCDLFGVVRR